MMILSMARDLYSTIEAVFSRTGSFSAGRTLPAKPPKPPLAACPTLAQAANDAQADMPVFIGIAAEEAYVERLAAD